MIKLVKRKTVTQYQINEYLMQAVQILADRGYRNVALHLIGEHGFLPEIASLIVDGLGYLDGDAYTVSEPGCSVTVHGDGLIEIEEDLAQ